MTGNDASVAAHGIDAIAAVRGYRVQVIAEAARRGQLLVTVSPSVPVPASPDACLLIGPVEIRLMIPPSRGRDDPARRMLGWSPAHEWAVAQSATRPPFAYHADDCDRPVELVPTPRSDRARLLHRSPLTEGEPYPIGSDRRSGPGRTRGRVPEGREQLPSDGGADVAYRSETCRQPLTVLLDRPY